MHAYLSAGGARVAFVGMKPGFDGAADYARCARQARTLPQQANDEVRRATYAPRARAAKANRLTADHLRAQPGRVLDMFAALCGAPRVNLRAALSRRGHRGWQSD